MEIKAVKLTTGLDTPITAEQIKSDRERITVLYCPRCQRPYKKGSGENYTDVLDRVKYHVSQQHPDHDPEWWDTYPEPDPVPAPNQREV